MKVIDIIKKTTHSADSTVFLCICLTLFSLGGIVGLYSSLRILALFSFLLLFVVNLKLKNILLSTFLIGIFSCQFISPNKYYFVQVINPRRLLDITYSGGYYSGYGISLANVFSALLLALLLRKILLLKNKRAFLERKKVILIISSLLFSTAGYYAATRYSPFLSLSLTWLFQYCQIYIFSFAFVSLYETDKRMTQGGVLTTLSVTVLLQFVLVLTQFIKQSALGISIENIVGTSYYTGLDENNALYRPGGSFMFHNQASLVLAICITLIFPHAITSKNKLLSFAVFCGFVSIVLLQTRSIWLSLFVIMILIIRLYKKELLLFLHEFGKKRLLMYSSALLFSMGMIVIPRILFSFNAGYDGAGLPVRFKLLNEGGQAFILNPWVGYGPGTNEIILNTFFPNGVTSIFPAAVHMGILQLLLEVGLIGVSAFLIPFIFILRESLKGKKMYFQKNVRGFLLASCVCGIYYLFLPHMGIVEFAYLGIVIGFGLEAVS